MQLAAAAMLHVNAKSCAHHPPYKACDRTNGDGYVRQVSHTDCINLVFSVRPSGATSYRRKSYKPHPSPTRDPITAKRKKSSVVLHAPVVEDERTMLKLAGNATQREMSERLYKGKLIDSTLRVLDALRSGRVGVCVERCQYYNFSFLVACPERRPYGASALTTPSRPG
ncbi:hypothetical protein BDU57DRAFT_513832 [Ampelomyces quisqualis]|uniref:Uncharacterized protein n=1 Tax=Ampelomyces quisqualis TaxID=50730 RepID=A0A6A5QRS4_AMPQU|nr:hypothetical protein BDU57DRAFT_513832 [Ampelomyces quisqualis]